MHHDIVASMYSIFTFKIYIWLPYDLSHHFYFVQTQQSAAAFPVAATQ